MAKSVLFCPINGHTLAWYAYVQVWEYSICGLRSPLLLTCKVFSKIFTDIPGGASRLPRRVSNLYYVDRQCGGAIYLEKLVWGYDLISLHSIFCKSFLKSNVYMMERPKEDMAFISGRVGGRFCSQVLLVSVRLVEVENLDWRLFRVSEQRLLK